MVQIIAYIYINKVTQKGHLQNIHNTTTRNSSNSWNLGSYEFLQPPCICCDLPIFINFSVINLHATQRQSMNWIWKWNMYSWERHLIIIIKYSLTELTTGKTSNVYLEIN